jgi:hypothetical protein
MAMASFFPSIRLLVIRQECRKTVRYCSVTIFGLWQDGSFNLWSGGLSDALVGWLTTTQIPK